jgi:hypothetical protein
LIISFIEKNTSSPTKVDTITSTAKKIYDESFSKYTFCIHPTIILFLTAMELSQKAVITENEDEDILSLNADVALQPFMAPVNHNSLNDSKTYQIVHTLMENYCHRDKDKSSQWEDMGNDATVLIGYHDEVCFEDICQIIQVLNYLFHYLTVLFIDRISLTKKKKKLK